jgi:signal transduction histidine kinase
VAAGVRWALHPLVEHAAPFLIFVLPVVLSALWGGPVAGGLATAFGAVLGTVLFIALGTDVPRNERAFAVVLFAFEGIVISWLAARVAATQRQLLTAKSEAEHANRAKDSFLAVLSHELRTPLNVIMGYSHMLRHRQPSSLDRLEKVAEIIERNAKLQTRLVEDLLDHRRIERGQLALEYEVFDLAPVIQSVRDSFKLARDAKRLHEYMNVRSVELEADCSRIQQVIWNLVSNAVKFTPEDGWISISTVERATDVQIVVENSGGGIPDHFRDRVFEPFQQLDMTTTRRHSGLGLGLAIVKNIVEMHHGTVAVESTTDRVTFTVTIPKRRVAPAVQTCAERERTQG